MEEERERLIDRRWELLEDEESNEMMRVTRKLGRAAGLMTSRLFSSYDSSEAQARAIDRMSRHIGNLSRTQARIIQQLTFDAVRLSELRAVLWMYRARRSWIALHITMTAILTTLVLVHVGSIAWFTLRHL